MLLFYSVGIIAIMAFVPDGFLFPGFFTLFLMGYLIFE